MPVEIEAKMKVEQFGPVRERLAAVGAKAEGDALETNVFFDTEDRSLLAGDRGLRIRAAARMPDGPTKNTITYKGPRLHGPLKSRDEREVNVDHAENAAALLESLGYLRVLSFQKRRQSWGVDGCKVELDELPHLGLFVEIEGPNEPAVMKVRDKLGLGDRPLVKASYIALLVTYLQERHINDRVVTFQR